MNQAHVAEPVSLLPAHARDSTVAADFTMPGTQSTPAPMSRRELEQRRLIHRHDSVRPHADAFRELRTRLLGLAGSRSFVTMVAPVTGRCGGSFVARNLTAAFAFDDNRSAILVDCDGRRPSQHSALGVDIPRGGVMDYLDDPTLDPASVVYETGLERVGLVPAGRTKEIVGEGFSSPRMHLLVDTLRGSDPCRHLVLDSPAVLGSPDARILSELVDFVVLVAGHGRTTMEAIEKAASAFTPGKLAGVVFNQGR